MLATVLERLLQFVDALLGMSLSIGPLCSEGKESIANTGAF